MKTIIVANNSKQVKAILDKIDTSKEEEQLKSFAYAHYGALLKDNPTEQELRDAGCSK